MKRSDTALLDLLCKMHSLLVVVVLVSVAAFGGVARAFPVSWKAPGNLRTGDVPQFILFTHDDNTDSRSSGFVTDVTKNFKNPNGCQINAAFYTTERYSDCNTVKKMYNEGHEIGGHSVTHRNLKKLSESEKKREVSQVRDWLINTCGIPAKDVRGWRSPYLSDDKNVRNYLEQAGYEYDTSLPEYFNSNTSPKPGRRLWPYSLKNGIKQTDSCRYFGSNLNKCDKNEKHNLIEIPMWMYQKSPNRPATKNLMDPPNAYQVLKAEFRRNYKAHRTPMGIWTHSTSTNFLNKANNRAEIKKFLSYALKKKKTWVVTPSQLLDWMANPVPVSQMPQFMSKYKCS